MSGASTSTRRARQPTCVTFLQGLQQKNIIHFGQLVRSKRPQKYDYGASKNQQLYGQRKPPEYNLSRVTTDVGVFWSKGDQFVTPQEVDELRADLRPRLKREEYIDDPFYTHLHFLMGLASKKALFRGLLDFLGGQLVPGFSSAAHSNSDAILGSGGTEVHAAVAAAPEEPLLCRHPSENRSLCLRTTVLPAGGEIEFRRWVVATVIAALIVILITAPRFSLIDGMLRDISDQQQTAVPLQDPVKHLLNSVPCNSTLCRRYSELISSCVGRVHGSPCDGLSHFVCGDGACYDRPFESLIRGYLRALAADALTSWRYMPPTSEWPTVDRAGRFVSRVPPSRGQQRRWLIYKHPRRRQRH
ncbi:hypothetical protein MRX96_049253 [Rhipicephalus microplus]